MPKKQTTVHNVRSLQDELAHRVSQLHATLQSIGDAVIATDDAGRITIMNPVAQKLTGWKESEALGKQLEEVFQIVNEETRAPVENPVTHVLREGVIVGLANHTLLIARDSTEYPIADAGAPIRNAQGEVVGVVLIFRDQSAERAAQRALQEAHLFAESIVNTVREPLLVLDAEMRVVSANRSFYQSFQVTPEETEGRFVYELGNHQWDIPELRRLLDEILPQNTQFNDYEVRHNFEHLGERIMLLNARRVYREPAKTQYILLAIEDITERKLTEEIQRHRLTELEAMHRVSTALREVQTSEEMLPLLLDETLAALECSAGSIWLLHPQNGQLRPSISRGWFETLPETFSHPGEGITGTVFENGEAYTSREFFTDPLVDPVIAEALPQGWGGICVPIRAAAQMVGVLFVSMILPRQVTPEETKLLSSVAEMAGVALHRLSLYQEIQRRLERLQALQTIDRAIAASLDSRITLDVLLSQVCAQLNVDAAGVLLYDPHSLILSYAAGRGFYTNAYERSRIRLGEGLAGRAAFDRRLVQVANLHESPDFLRAGFLKDEGFEAYIAIPFTAKSQLKGVLEVFQRGPLDSDTEWLSFLETLAGQAAIAIENTQLFEELQRSNIELGLAYDATIEGWSRALDLRDRETEGHTQRVTEMTLRLARAAGIAERDLVHVKRGALLHDIGKMGIPDVILHKPDKLTEDEWAIMRQHPIYAYELLLPVVHLRSALDIPYCHHEKWDGTGYPRGLKGEEIPLAARLFAVVDVWDALLSNRPYRKAWPEDQARQYLRAQAGAHFDPKAVELFFQLIR